MSKGILLIVFVFNFMVTGFTQTKVDTLKQKLLITTNEEIKLRVLDTLTQVLIKSNSSEQSIYLKKVVLLAKKLNNYDLAASKTRFIAQNYIYKNQSDSAIYEVEDMLKYKSKFATKKSEAHLLLKRGAAYFNKEMLEQASQDYDTSADLFLMSGDSIFAADARFFAGQVYTDLKNFITSVERFKQAYKIYDRLGDKDYSNYTLNELSSLYGRNGFYDKAIYERKRVLSNAKKLKNYIAMTFAYVHLASGYFDKKEYDTYKKYNDSIALNLDSIKNKYNHAEFSFQLSKMNLEYSLKTDNLEKANFFLKETKNKIKFGKLETYYEKPILYLEALLNFKNKKFNKAKKGLEKLLNKKNKGPVKIIMRAEKKLADIYEQEKKYAKAFYHLSNYLNLKNEYDSQIKTNTFLYYQSEFETERKDNEIYKKETEISLLEKDKEIAKSKRKLMVILLISIFLLSIVISFYIWKQGKEKSKKLSLKIDKNKKELKEFTDLLIEKSKTQHLLTLEIENLKEEIGEVKSIERLQDLTAIKILTNDDWYNFKEKFKSVYPSFFVSIRSKGFTLTKSEERLIAMEKLYLDTNEIANMLAISQESVTRSRSRLRKKINAPKGTPILEYLEAS